MGKTCGPVPSASIPALPHGIVLTYAERALGYWHLSEPVMLLKAANDNTPRALGRMIALSIAVSLAYGAALAALACWAHERFKPGDVDRGEKAGKSAVRKIG